MGEGVLVGGVVEGVEAGEVVPPVVELPEVAAGVEVPPETAPPEEAAKQLLSATKGSEKCIHTEKRATYDRC